ncbi:MAG TPA: hypothetical protein VL793_05725, partial [Patescibacteria group bacterium]|nr:hypothetical protein [Patescibacteria group bacterium]
MRKTSRKLKTLIAAIGIAIACGLAWKYTHPVPAEISELSRADFGRMEQTVRNAMWQKAFAGSTWKPLTSPRALWRLATARISQIELLPAGGAEVKLHTSLGDYYYCLVRNEPKEQSGWRVLSEGQGRQVSLHVDGIWATFSQVKVDGGVGLFGGRLS